MRQRTPLAMMQPLESRMFLSVAPSSTVDTNPTIIADRAQLAADQQTLRTDYQAGEAKIVADHKAIADELAKLEPKCLRIHGCLQQSIFSGGGLLLKFSVRIPQTCDFA